MRTFSISIDDGYPYDLTLGENLRKMGLISTFYIPKWNRENRPVLSFSDIRELNSMGHHIGSHTYSHRYLTSVDGTTARREIVDGNNYIQDVVGKKVTSFCFPGGKYNSNILKFVEQMGFDFVRTIHNFNVVKREDFLVKTAFQLYPHSKTTLIKNFVSQKFMVDPSIVKFRFCCDFTPNHAMVSNLPQSDAHLHFWMHSWEICEQSIDYMGFFNQIQDYGWINKPLENFITSPVKTAKDIF